MSLLSNFVKQIESIQVIWIQEKQDLQQHATLLHWLETGQSACTALPSSEIISALQICVKKTQQLSTKLQNELLDHSSKLQVKMAAVDPITGEPRYGQSAQSKFQASQQHLQELASDLSATLTQYEELAGRLIFLSENQKQVQTAEQTAEAERKAREEEASRQAQLLEETRLKKEAEDREAAALLELHQKAEMIRKQKEHEAKAKQIFEEEAQVIMEAITSKINKQFSSMDDVVLAQYLQHVKDFCQPSNAANVQQRTVRDVLGMVISILERIIGRPDDSNARKIRLTHPAIQSKITSIPGCIQILIAIGFFTVLKDTSIDSSIAASNPKAEQEVEEAKKPWNASKEELQKTFTDLQTKLATGGTVNDISNIVMMLHPHTPFEMFFEMEEPVLDTNLIAVSEGKDAWITWYDGLKHHLQVIQEVLMRR